jgi:galactose mutarotase-like enzyme
VVASLDNFSADSRTYPVEFWNYERVDLYETVVNITAPSGTKFVELPSTETLFFKDLKYTIQYTLKAPDKLTIVRKFTNTRQQQIPPADYAAFKAFFEKIIKAENKFIAFK